jgi:hypothetical protein
MGELTPMDEELRERLRRHVALSPADTGRLPDALHRGRRARRRRQQLVVAGGVAGAAGIAAVTVLGVGFASHQDRSKQTITPANPARLLGTFSRTVDAPATQAVRGRWSLTFRGDDTLAVRPPPRYRGVVSGVSFRPTGGEVRIDLFVQDRCAGQPVGVYRWSRDATGLHLTAISDPCNDRRAVLAATDWHPGL